MRYEAIKSPAYKIEYLFHRIGKFYFKNSVEEHSTDLLSPADTSDYTVTLPYFDKTALQEAFKNELVCITTCMADKRQKLDMTLFDLQSHSYDICHELDSPVWMTLFLDSVEQLIEEFDPYPCFKTVVAYFTIIRDSLTQGPLIHRLSDDPDSCMDNINYLAEMLSQWHSAFEYNDPEALLAATIDCIDAMRHFIVTCLETVDAEKTQAPVAEIRPVTVPETMPLHANRIGSRELISADELFSEVDIDAELLDELSELEDDIAIIDTVIQLDQEIADALSQFFRGFASMLNTYVEFRSLGDSLLMLGTKIEEVDLSADTSMTVSLLRSIVTDLLAWKRHIFIERSAKDIHYMDDSFNTNIAQVEMLLAPIPANDGDGDIEFF
jgi:hypothetical protein